MTSQGALDAAVACVQRNMAVGQEVSIEDGCAWALGAASRHENGEPEPTPLPKPVVAVKDGDGFERKIPASLQWEAAKASGLLGDPCTSCGQFMLKRTRTCTTCQGCGSNSGCS